MPVREIVAFVCPKIARQCKISTVPECLRVREAEVTMPVRRTAEEIGHLGDEMYERNIRPKVEAAHFGEVIAIDVDSGDYAVADTARSAARGLRERHPDASVWLMRVGYPTLRCFGGGTSRRMG